jgi:Protein of unknown function (DUF642)
MRRICTIAASAVLLVSTGMASVLTNGNFANGFAPNIVDGGESLSVGSTAMPGWTVVGANPIAWAPSGLWPGVTSAVDSAYVLDLTGYDDPDTESWGGIEQTVDLAAGNYALTFYLGQVIDFTLYPQYSDPVSVDVSAGNQSDVSFTDTNETLDTVAGQTDWQMETLNFTVGTAGPTTIEIVGLSAGTDLSTNGNFIGLDDVDLEDAPEPGTAPLLSIIVAGLLLKARPQHHLRLRH